VDGRDKPGHDARFLPELSVTARDEILASVRRSLRVSGDEAPRRAAVAARVAQAPIGIVPARGQGDPETRIATFKAEAARAAATITEVASPADVPAEIARYLREGNMAATLRMGADARLAAMPWAATTIEISHGPSDGHDLNAVSAAFAAVAETGTLALVSGADNPTTLNFLPDNHIAVVFASDVVGDFEAVFARLRAAYGAGAAPRTLNFITGPSRSADIEQTLMFGAHGPRRLHIVLVA
jgi:L-lactate dehydrogenase complex protein LldG